MNNTTAPTIVRLLRFPTSLRLTRKGRVFAGPLKRSGALVVSERHATIDITLRVTDTDIEFQGGEKALTVVEAFTEGEQRDLLVPWGLVVRGRTRTKLILMEVEVGYEGTPDRHIATVPLKLTYAIPRPVVAAGVAVAAAAVAVAVARQRKSAAKRAATKKASAKKASAKKAPAKKASAKKASAKKAGGTRRGSSASRSAPRKGARGSSAARKSSRRPPKRKSR